MAEYYVDVAVGDDGNLGTSEGAGNAWETLAKAADEVAAGDTVHIKASGDYIAQDGANDCVLYLSTDGTAGSPITWEGYTSTPGDGGQAIIDASDNSLAYSVNGSAGSFNAFKNLRMTGASSYGFAYNPIDCCYFENCRFDNNGSIGVFVDNYNIFYRCQADKNGDAGFFADNSMFIGCKSFDNTFRGIRNAFAGVILHCICYGNGTAQILVNSINIIVSNCVVDGENSTIGIHQDSVVGYGSLFFNNIIFDCDTGISCDGDVSPFQIEDYNLFFSNTTDLINITAGANSISGSEDPFTDSASHNYTLKSNSEAEDAGFDMGEF